MDIRPGSTLGHYRMIETIGAGGMGVVWRAHDERLGRDVAIKLLPADVSQRPELLARLEREARTIASLNHPNIVTVYSVEECDGVRFVTMEMIPGRTLREVIPSGGLALDRLLEIAAAIGAALAAAHARGIVHRDLKPANVMISGDGAVKVLDFGLARSTQADAVSDGDWATRAPTAEDAFAGTLHYMAPEQLRGHGADARADVFAFGVLLYQMATGRRAFEGETLPALAASILTDAAIPPSQLRPELPRRLDEIVARCLEKDRELRLQSAEELCELVAGLRRHALAAAGPALPSIAVLPFADLSPHKDHDWFCEGLAEEVRLALGHVDGLRVASRASSFQFRGMPLGSREMGRRLGVRQLLEGSVRAAAGQLRISIELADVEAGACLWSKRYDRRLEDVFAVQDEIANDVAAAMRVELGDRARLARRRAATANVEAYEYYLRGRLAFDVYNRRGVQQARQLFTRAVEIDPDYALAHAGLADCGTYLFMHVIGQEALRDAALESAQRAVELDPELAQAHVSLGLALSLTRDHAAAEREFEHAVRLDPRLFEAHYFYARDAFMQHQPEKALRLYERACALRPEDYQAPLLMAQIQDDSGRAREAEAARRAGIRAAETRLALQPDDVRALYMGANGLVALGDVERGLEWAQRAYALDPEDAMLLYNLACIHAMAGRRESALDFLERSVQAGMNFAQWLRNDSNLDSLRDDARFVAVADRLEHGAGSAPATP